MTATNEMIAALKMTVWALICGINGPAFTAGRAPSRVGITRTVPPGRPAVSVVELSVAVREVIRQARLGRAARQARQ
jgi:hypothetical protein